MSAHRQAIEATTKEVCAPNVLKVFGFSAFYLVSLKLKKSQSYMEGRPACSSPREPREWLCTGEQLIQSEAIILFLAGLKVGGSYYEYQMCHQVFLCKTSHQS